MANQNDSDMQLVIESLRSEITRQQKTLGYIGAAGRPDPLTNVTQHQWVNPHLPIGWPAMPRGLVAKVVAYTKKIVRSLLRWYIVPIVDQQNVYNCAVSEALSIFNSNAQELAHRIDMLEKAIADKPKWPIEAQDVDDAHSLPQIHRLAGAAERYRDLLRPYTLLQLLIDTVGGEDKSIAILGKTSPVSCLCSSTLEAATYLKDQNAGAVSVVLVAVNQHGTLLDLNQLITLAVSKLAMGGLLLIEIVEKQCSTTGSGHVEDVRCITWPAMFMCSLLEKAGLPHTQVRFIPKHEDEHRDIAPLANTDVLSLIQDESRGYAAFAYKEE